jgi:hypothetical protein
MSKTSQIDMEEFLKQHTCYDVLPVSFRLVVFDTHLSVKKALSMLVKNGNTHIIRVIISHLI